MLPWYFGLHNSHFQSQFGNTARLEAKEPEFPSSETGWWSKAEKLPGGLSAPHPVRLAGFHVFMQQAHFSVPALAPPPGSPCLGAES